MHDVKRAGAVAAALSLASACTTTAPVDSDFPDPAISPLPLTVGLQYSEEFRNYVYRDQIPGEPGWVVIMGTANTTMFDKVLGGMFDESVSLTGSGPPSERVDDVDVIIEPEVESYEFAIPTEWGTNNFTVWITYRMNMYRSDGSLIASWPVRAYGESRFQFFNKDESLADATTMAIRDAGAYLALYFAEEPKVREWLREEGAQIASKKRRARGVVKRR
jgi:hypothetical protein